MPSPLNSVHIESNTGEQVNSVDVDGQSLKMNRKRARPVSSTADMHLSVPPLDLSKVSQHPTTSNKIPNDSPKMFTKYYPSSPSTSVVSVCDDQKKEVKTSSEKENSIPSDERPEILNEDRNQYLSPDILRLHRASLEIESKLVQFKPLLSKLMVHPSFNRRGTFNVPVDPVKLGLKDYTTIIKHPMDLGTVKVKLHANLYLNEEAFASDVRLVFRNAQAYNPPSHPVHEAAKGLLSVFEEGYAIILAKANSISNTTDDMALNVSSLPLPVAAGLCQPIQRHTCKSCRGQVCALCSQGCLSLESSLLICAGAVCAGAKIRKGATYFCSLEGSKTWCQRCYANLPTTIPNDDGSPSNGQVELKKSLLKRRNEEDVVERWVTCSVCSNAMHEICAFSNEFASNLEDFVCPSCSTDDQPFQSMNIESPSESYDLSTAYSFLSGEEMPQEIKHVLKDTYFDAGSLPESAIASFLEKKVQNRMRKLNCPPNAEKTLKVRVISNCDRNFQVPEVVQRHFRMMKETNASQTNTGEFEAPPSDVKYKSTAIALFQRIDGMDICIFCMYVQEYDDTRHQEEKRVYIAYLDSVEHFRPRKLRSDIFHEILVAYLATARIRGFDYAHIWSCPPTRGNSFVFWAHPTSQKNPTKERLLDWYHKALSLAVDCGIVTNVKSLYEFSFQQNDAIRSQEVLEPDGLMLCPPLLDGDFWVEEAQRINSSVGTTKIINSKQSSSEFKLKSQCPAVQLLNVLEDEIMSNSTASPFCNPVNAVALRLLDYHDIIKKPMDLGTIHSKLVRGEYDTFRAVVDDLELVFNNAMLYNPKGHIVHTMAESMRTLTTKALGSVVKHWYVMGIGSLPGNDTKCLKFEHFANVSMRLGVFIRNQKENSSSLKTNQSVADVVPSENDGHETKGLMIPNVLSGGVDAIARSMVGEDIWMLERRELLNKKKKKKKKQGKKRPRDESGKNEASKKKRRECWLADELGSVVKQLRTDFFVCYLKQSEVMSEEEKEKLESFMSYVSEFQPEQEVKETICNPERRQGKIKPALADTRHGLLEFSQYRNFQFDTIRRAKYSTAMLIRYLLNPNAPGLIPNCTNCKNEIVAVRWHKINKAFDERRRNSATLAIRMASVDMDRGELCSTCFELEDTKQKELYVPIRVSFERGDFLNGE